MFLQCVILLNKHLNISSYFCRQVFCFEFYLLLICQTLKYITSKTFLKYNGEKVFEIGCNVDVVHIFDNVKKYMLF